MGTFRENHPVFPDKARETVTYHASLPLRFFYHTLIGRIFVRPLLFSPFSRLAGLYMDSRLSRGLIAPFIRKNGIRMDDFEDRAFTSFNDFFTRHIREGMRPFSAEPTDFCAPCDAVLSVYPLKEGTTFRIKESTYTLPEILTDTALAEAYQGGTALIFRLSAPDYHRYVFPDDCRIGRQKTIPGLYHTVQPIAINNVPVFHRNTRVWTELNTVHFDKILFMEVGALLVGRICNHPGLETAKRGEEKGYFAFGGSTIILFMKQDAVTLDPIFLANTEKGLETRIRQGEVIGRGGALA